MHKFKQLLECSDKTAVDVIVKCFAAMAISNSVLMTDNLIMKNRQHFDAFVRNFRQQYQQLLLAAIFAFDANPRFRSRTPVEKIEKNLNFNLIAVFGTITWIEPLTLTQRQMEIQSTVADNTEERSARVNQYRNDTKRLNVHAGIHFERIIAEYDLFSNYNVLIGEDKHRYFKKIVYYTNHSNIEKTMLLRENLRQTVRLFLLNGFAYTEPKIIQLIKNIHQHCSSLFITLLPRSKQMLFENDDSDSRLSKNIVENDEHFQFNVIGCLELKYCRNVLKLSTRSSENVQMMPRSFKTALAFVYQKDYAIPNLMHFGTNAIQ